MSFLLQESLLEAACDSSNLPFVGRLAHLWLGVFNLSTWMAGSLDQASRASEVTVEPGITAVHVCTPVSGWRTPSSFWLLP